MGRRMNRVDQIAKLIETRWSLEEIYKINKEAVRKKYPTHPPQTEVHKYSSVKEKINRINKEISRISGETV